MSKMKRVLSIGVPLLLVALVVSAYVPAACLKSPERGCVVRDQPQQSRKSRLMAGVPAACGWSSTQPRAIFRQALGFFGEFKPGLTASVAEERFHLALLLAAPVLGAEEGTVDGVLGRYVKAIGGKEAWNKVESRSIKAEYRAVDGLQYPHVQQLRISGAGQEIEFRMKVEQVKHDEKFEDSIFSKPSA